MKRTGCDLLLVGGILLLALLLFLAVRPGEQGAYAVVRQDGEEIGRYPLDQDRTVTIGEEQYNILQIEGGAASVMEANCGDHTCVRTGAVSREGEVIVCLPHKLIVEITGGGTADFDAIAR